MTQLVQIYRLQERLRKISPQWANQLEPIFRGAGGFDIFYKMSNKACFTRLDSKHCLVGEAHGGNDDYKTECDECCKFAFNKLLGYNRNEFLATVEQFCDHWEIEHV